MRDFTLDAYSIYLEAIKSANFNVVRFDEYMGSSDPPSTACILRHDVDRRPQRALRMAELEHEHGVAATYYFRGRDGVFCERVITAVARMGHEVGYHYEDLSRCRGDRGAAERSFALNLAALRQLAPVRTAAMHGAPLSRFDNRELWASPEARKRLKTEHGLLGEVYLDIDYGGIAYISDTGRNWSAGRSNRRDHIASATRLDLRSGEDLVELLRSAEHPKVVLQIHPERWTAGAGEYWGQWLTDAVTNTAKHILRPFV